MKLLYYTVSINSYCILFNITECDYPEAIQYGNITLSDDGLSAIYDCEVGYSINGTTKRICLADGIGWSGYKPSCGIYDITVD